jgi:hypothetical protein
MKKNKLYLLLFWVSVLAMDLIELFFTVDSSELSAYSIVTTFILSFIMFAWFMADAEEIGLTPSYGLKVAVVTLSFAALPYYLIRYKGWARGLFSMLKFALIALVYFAFMELLDRYLNA